MSAADKVIKLSMSPRELADQIQKDVADNGGDTDVVVARLTKEFTGRRRAMLPTVIEEWLITDHEPPKIVKKLPPKSDRIARMQRAAAKLQRQIEREAEAVELVEKRAIARFAANATRHDLWKIGNKFGKKNCRTVIWKAFSEKELAAAGVIKA